MSTADTPALGSVAAVAAGLDDVIVERDPVDPALTRYRRGTRLFARVSPGGLEVRLPEDIAEAALRTPETSAVPGEPGWIRFAPGADRRDVRDRAEAWFRTAWRHAAS